MADAQNGRVLLAMIGILMGSSYLDHYGPATSIRAESPPEEKTIPSLRGEEIAAGNSQHLVFSFCVSCGYKAAFQQYAEAVTRQYPDMIVTGQTYNPPFPKGQIAQALTVTKLLVIIMVVSGVNPFTYLNSPTPRIWSWLQTNKIYGCMLVFFLAGMVETQLISSGAFEIYLDQEQIWSKIQTGRAPEPQELFALIDARRDTGFRDRLDADILR